MNYLTIFITEIHQQNSISLLQLIITKNVSIYSLKFIAIFSLIKENRSEIILRNIVLMIVSFIKDSFHLF